MTRETCNDLFQYAKNQKNAHTIQKKQDRAYEKGYGRFSWPGRLPNEDGTRYLVTWDSFDHDPAKFWSWLTILSYVVLGGNDWFIPVRESVDILRGLLRGKPGILTIKQYPAADHFIKKSIKRNNFDFSKYPDNYLADLTEWIIHQANELRTSKGGKCAELVGEG